MPPAVLAVVVLAAAVTPIIYNELSKDDPDKNKVPERKIDEVAAGLGLDAPTAEYAKQAQARSEAARTGADGGWTGDVDTTQLDQSRAQQLKALGLVEDSANGRGPSAAQGVLQQGLNDSMTANRALAASARGGGANAAAAMRSALLTNQRTNMQGAAQASILRANEMNAARAQYMQGATGLRQTDWAQAGGMASLKGQAQGLRDQRELSFAELARRNRADQFSEAVGLTGQDLARRTGNAGYESQMADRNKKGDAAAIGQASNTAIQGYQLVDNAYKADAEAAAKSTATNGGGVGTTAGIGPGY